MSFDTITAPSLASDQHDFFTAEKAEEEAKILLQSKAHKHPINLQDYDSIIVAFSGGKDSVACVLQLLECGVDPSRIEIHHHNVDGEHSDTEGLMDWPVTHSYCHEFAKAFGMSYSESFRLGGIERELDRNNEPTAAVSIPYIVDGQRVLVGGKGKPNTRLKFPQVSADLSTRWCSSVVKISCMDAWLRNDPRFNSGKTLIVTGERAEESSNRAKYHAFEPHRADNRNGLRVRRFVDHWRPVHKFTEQMVWDLIKKYSVSPHPSYMLGFSRTSCRSCIFADKHQWATIKLIAPNQFKRIAAKEEGTGLTIHRSHSVIELASIGTPYTGSDDAYWVTLGNSKFFSHPIICTDWVMPKGAFGSSCGPN